MFFRREKPRNPSFSELMDELRKQGFAVQSEPSGGIRVMKHGCAAVVIEKPGAGVQIVRIGVLVGNEIGVLCDAGYQKFWLTPSGQRPPATAEQLRALHNFEEDLREGLSMVSLYNQGLGTVNEVHIYDRV